MSKHAIAALAGLLALAACGGSAPRPLTYGPAAAPDALEQAAGDQAQAAFQAGRSFATASDPTTSTPGLADQLASTMGGEALPTGTGTLVSAPVAGALLASLPAEAPATARQAFGMALAPSGPSVVVSPFDDPNCVAISATAEAGSATWSGCVIHDQLTDPDTGEVTTVVLRIDGRLTWSAATGTTSWTISESMVSDMPFGDATMNLRATVALNGAITNKDGHVKGSSASAVGSTVSLPGISASGGVTTTLSVDLSYVGDPLCVTTGTLTVEQRYSGAAAGNTPDQGWKLEWTGDGVACGALSVAHGQ